MPRAPLKSCNEIGCKALTATGYCEAHTRARPAGQVRHRPDKYLYGRRWQQARRVFLAEFPLCAECQAHGRTTAATDVDHIQPHRGDEGLFWDDRNWQPLCKSCHSRKTAGQDGGFNNPKGSE